MSARRRTQRSRRVSEDWAPTVKQRWYVDPLEEREMRDEQNAIDWGDLPRTAVIQWDRVRRD